MSRVLLTLDLATSTGFALWQPGNQPRLGTKKIPDTGNDVGLFLAKFEDWLLPFAQTAGVTDVFFEAAYVGPRTTQQVARKLFALGGFTEYLCLKSQLRCYEMQVAQWRRHFIGDNPRRTDAHRLTKNRCDQLGICYRNQDEADAFGMLDFAAHKLVTAGVSLPQPDWAAGALFGHRRAS